MQWRDDTTLPSRGQSLRAIGKSRFTLACAGSAVFLLPFLAAQLPGYEHVGQALRFCLSDLVIIKAVPARTCTALGLDLGEQTLNAMRASSCSSFCVSRHARIAPGGGG